MGFRQAARDIGVNILAQLIWVALVFGSGAALVIVFGSVDQGQILKSHITVATWLVVVLAALAMATGLLLLWVTRKASAVRGRDAATRANLTLFRERTKVPLVERMVLSTRFGRWPPSEVLEHRSSFRQELDKSILVEGTEVRRIWNVSSMDDVTRLREVLEKYRGRTNHSIRAYFNLPNHAMPEILVVNRQGASIAFPSSRTAHDLDWTIRFRRRDLVQVVREYFDVLWDRAERILDAGEVTATGQRRLDEVAREYLAVAGPRPGGAPSG